VALTNYLVISGSEVDYYSSEATRKF